jgi:hypothetical protein
MWPMQKAMKRFQNGLEDSIYVYGHHVIKEYVHEPFDQSYWEIASKQTEYLVKPWWKFW